MFVPGVVERDGVPVAGADTSTGAEKIKAVKWTKEDGTVIVPFFSSLEEMYKVDTLKSSPSVELPARYFFESMRGNFLVLNPFSQHWKELHPDEVTGLLSDEFAVELRK